MKPINVYINESIKQEYTINESVLGSLLLIAGGIYGFNYLKKKSKELLAKLDNKIGEWWSNRVLKKSEELNKEIDKLVKHYPDLAKKINTSYISVNNANSFSDWLMAQDENKSNSSEISNNKEENKVLSSFFDKANSLKEEIKQKFKSLNTDDLKVFSDILNININNLKKI